MSLTSKERDIAGCTAFEVALQSLFVRQDRSYFFVQLINAACFSTLVGGAILYIILLFSAQVPTTNGTFLRNRAEEWYSPITSILAVVGMILCRASKKKFVIEPGSQLISRLNDTILEPHLGMKFDCESGKLYSDGKRGVAEIPQVAFRSAQ